MLLIFYDQACQANSTILFIEDQKVFILTIPGCCLFQACDITVENCIVLSFLRFSMQGFFVASEAVLELAFIEQAGVKLTEIRISVSLTPA